MHTKRRKSLPLRHLIPQWLRSDPQRAKTVADRLRARFAFPLVQAAYRRALRRFEHDRSEKNLAQLVRWQTRIGGWNTAATTAYDQMQVVDFRQLPSEPPVAERMFTPPGGTPYFYPTRVVEAMHHSPKNARYLAISAGGIGDLVIYAQLFAQMRKLHGTTIDIGHQGLSFSDDLLQRLFAPARIHRFPLAESVFKTYDAVMPMAMYRVLNGETLPEYFARAYSTPLVASGFTVDNESAKLVHRRLFHRHGIDAEKERPIFIHAGCRPGKNYPHFDAVAAALMARGHKVVLIGDERDSVMRDDPGTLANLCGLDLWQTFVALRHARLFIGPDSSFMHAAAAWDVPSLALFGPTPLYWSSAYPKTTGVVFANACKFLPCWMSLDRVPPCGETRDPPCLSQISVDYVVTLAERKLAGDLNEPWHSVSQAPVRRITSRSAALGSKSLM